MFDYLKGLFGIDANTLATIVITIGVFLLGYLFNHLNNVLVAHSERRVLRKIIITSLAGLIREVDNQSKAFAAIESDLSIDNKETFQLVTVTMGSLKVFQSIGYEKMYRCFFSGFENTFRKSNKRLEAFASFWNILETLGQIDANMQQDYKDFRTNYLIVNEHRNLLSIKIQKMVDDTIVFLVTTPHNLELLQLKTDFNELISNYAKSPDNNLPQNVQNYHRSLKPFANKHMEIIKKYSKELPIHEMMPYLSEASYRFSELQQLLFISADNYRELKKSFQGHTKKLSYIKSQLS